LQPVELPQLVGLSNVAETSLTVLLLVVTLSDMLTVAETSITVLVLATVTTLSGAMLDATLDIRIILYS